MSKQNFPDVLGRSSRLAASAVLLAALVYFTLGAPQHLESRIEVVKIHEELLFWEALYDPIGVRLKIELRHPKGLKLTLPAPQIIMGEFSAFSPPEPFYTQPFYSVTSAQSDSRLSMLKATSQTPFTLPPNRFDPDAEATVFTYEIFPGTIYRLDGAKTFCLFSNHHSAISSAQQITPEIPDMFYAGENLSAYWVGLGENRDIAIDLSSAFTAALRSSSYFQGRPDRWQSMQMVFSPDELRKNPRYHREIWRGHELCFTRESPNNALQTRRTSAAAANEAEAVSPAQASLDPQMAALRQAVEAGDTRRALVALAVLQRLGPNAVEAAPYLTALLVTHSALCDVAGNTLATIGPEAVPWVLPYVNNPNPEIRRRMMAVLGMVRPAVPEAAEALMAGLNDNDVSVRRFAAFALVDNADLAGAALTRLQDLVRDDVVPVRHSAATALGSFGAPAVDTLAEALVKDENKSVRIAGVRALLQMGEQARSAEWALKQALNDKDRYVRMYAQRALEGINPKPAPQTDFSKQ